MRRGHPSAGLTTCRNCESKFSLDTQYYYDNLCPSCKEEQDGKEAVVPGCTHCGEKCTDGVQYARYYEPPMRSAENVPVCSSECQRKVEGTPRP